MPKTVRAAAYAPDGTELTYDSVSVWDVAGIAQRTDSGRWVELTHGSSYDSVKRRALTYAGRSGSYDYLSVRAVRIYEATAPCVREYFGTHRVRIVEGFKPGEGYVKLGKHAGWSVIRKLSKQGFTSLNFSDTDLPRADFPMAELLKSMHLPKQQMCATQGHDHLPATLKISYTYAGETETRTELVCKDCAEIVENAGDVVTKFSSHPLAA